MLARPVPLPEEDGLCSNLNLQLMSVQTLYEGPFQKAGGAYRIKYVIDRGCWICVSHKPRESDGVIQIRRGRQMAMSRYIYELRKGEVREGFNVLHTCGEKRCINPDHLEQRPFQHNQEYPEGEQREIAQIAHEISVEEAHRRFGAARATIRKYRDRYYENSRSSDSSH